MAVEKVKVGTAKRRKRGERSVVDRIVETIKEGVRVGRYVPGQRLIENDFVTETGFSRGPLREALRRLEAEGVVVLEKNRGAVVRRYSREEIRQIYDLRLLLEPYAARLAARRLAEDDEARSRLEASRRNMQKSIVEDLTEYAREQARFHILVAEASGNVWLARLIETLQLPVDRLGVVQFVSRGWTKGSVKDQSIREHEEIVDALLAGDASRAEKIMRVHVRHSLKMWESLPDRVFL